jgi:type II restriction enzyme
LLYRSPVDLIHAVNLALPTEGLERYHSASQRARVATESWAVSSLYCANCDSPALNPAAANMPAIDFDCPRCDALFQLKGQSRPVGGRIPDAAYSAMKRAIDEDRTPNLFVLHYELESWRVRNLFLVPQFAFSLAAIEKRKPLADTARRHGWVGCTIILANIPPDAKIKIISDGEFCSPRAVRAQYQKLRPLQNLGVKKRGWTLDTLNALHTLKQEEFTLADAYSLVPALSKLHPANRHVHDKIRQQLQELRDLGFLEFLGRGRYRFT